MVSRLCWIRIALAWALVAASSPVVLAQEPAPPVEGQKQEQDAKDPFAVPDTKDLAVLGDFLNGVLNFQPSTADEARRFRTAGVAAAKKAADLILELDKERTSDAASMAAGFVMMMKMQDLPQMTAEQKKELVSEAIEHLKKVKKPTPQDLGMAMQLTSGLEFSENEALAAEAAEGFAKVLKGVEIPGVEGDFSETLEGVARRLSLKGQPLQLTGTNMVGEPFDIASLKGKVVLVDFWATWCGPCRAESPNIKRHYEANKDRGFEVVGVSLDQDREALEKYLAEEEVSWLILHDRENPGASPATKYYGIMGIPTMILLDRDGKVVSTKARGAELDQLMAQLFPPEKRAKVDSEPNQ